MSKTAEKQLDTPLFFWSKNEGGYMALFLVGDDLETFACAA